MTENNEQLVLVKHVPMKTDPSRTWVKAGTYPLVRVIDENSPKGGKALIRVKKSLVLVPNWAWDYVL